MIPHNRPTIDFEEIEASTNVLKSAMLSQGAEVEEFENEMCEFLGLPKGHAVAVSSGSAALYLALWSMEAKGKNVAFPSYVCSAIRNAVNLIGAKEAVIDVKKDSPNMDINELNKMSPDIAIVPHMFGIPCDIFKINKNIKIIEDCAQSLGAKINEISTGLIGDVGILSFYATKLITSGGQGGMVISKNKSLIDKIKDYREFDCRHDEKSRFNFQMTDLQATIGRVQLKKLPQFLKKREEIYQAYLNAGLDLIDCNRKNISAVRYRAVLKTNNPQKIINDLKKQGIKTIVPIEDWELLQKTPNALELTKKTVSLPLYPSLTNENVEKIIKGIRL